ncbi:MAG: RDD family protein [Eubacteriales bacterium]|jgi:uncharacterized RDD family membrane protein YckC
MDKVNEKGTIHAGSQQEQQIKSFPLPWDRFWARCIDLPIHYLILFLILIFSGVSSYVAGLTPIEYKGVKVLIIAWAVLSAEFILYEFIFLSIFGATPGKALFRIKVTGNDGKKLSFSAALVRALSVYCFGHYLFVFQEVFVIAYWFSSRYYKKTGTFRWDKASDSVVSQGLLTLLRRKLLILLAIFCITLRLSPVLIIVYKFFN